MAEKDVFKITNPNAPFIKFVDLMDKHFHIPRNKYGDMNWLSNNVHLYINKDIENPEKNKILKKAKSLILILTFKTERKSDVS